MVHESLDSAHGLYAIGAVFLILGIIGTVAGTLMKRRREEDHQDERYVRARRGGEVVATAPPRETRRRGRGLPGGAGRRQDRRGDGVRFLGHRRVGAVGADLDPGAGME